MLLYNVKVFRIVVKYKLPVWIEPLTVVAPFFLSWVEFMALPGLWYKKMRPRKEGIPDQGREELQKEYSSKHNRARLEQRMLITWRAIPGARFFVFHPGLSQQLCPKPPLQHSHLTGYLWSCSNPAAFPETQQQWQRESKIMHIKLSALCHH